MEKFDINFSGETLPGHDLETVKRHFGQLLGFKNTKQIDNAFSGREITLRRNLDKDEAAQFFVKMRKIGAVTQIKKVLTEEVVMVSDPLPTADPAPRTQKPKRKRRQPGAPNLFDLRLSARAGLDPDSDERGTLGRAPIIASAILMLAFILVGLRFWAESQAAPAPGLGNLAIDAGQQPVVEVNNQLLFHDRAGIATDSIALSELGASSGAAFDFFSNGDILLLRRERAPAAPEWLHPVLGIEPPAGARLSRCTLDTLQCTDLLEDLDEVEFVIERRTNTIYLANATSDRLEKRSADGELIASLPMELTSPLSLTFQEGIIYLTQGGSDAVAVLKPDDKDFGKALDNISLQVEGASQSGHIYPADLAWLNEQWWTLMQSRDGSTAGIYLFDPRWRYQSALPLPANARPVELSRWSNKMLALDHQGETIHRFDAAARPEKAFSSDSIDAELGEKRSSISLSRSLQVLILMILFVAAAGLLALGTLQTLRHKVYFAKSETDEKGFDINDEAIEWLDPAPDMEQRLRKIGYIMAGASTLLLIGAFIAQLNIWSLIALCILIAGLGGYYFALNRASGCHLGLLDDNLIVVDHTNTYRVGRGPKIQYLKNFIMVDDVIVFLGNRLVHQFAREQLLQNFEPVVTRGIRVDRTTLQVKLIHGRHPLLLGVAGMLLAVIAALLLVALTR